MAVIRFIATTRAGRNHREKEREEETEARDVRHGMESERMEGDNEEENGEDR